MSEKVLLVDDEEDLLEAMAERMRNQGIEVSTTTSARDALIRTQEEPFDAMVIDLMMPEMDGIEVLKAVKERNPDLKVILLTGLSTVEKGVEAMKLGALDLMEKPADLKVLIDRIKSSKSGKSEKKE